MKIRKPLALTLDLQTFAGSKSLDELLQERAGIYDQQKAILDKAEEENRDLTAEEEQQFSNLEKDYEKVEAKVKTAQVAEDRKAKLNARGQELNKPQQEPYRPSTSALGGMPAQPKKLDDGGFANLGEFLDAVRFGDPKGRLAEVPRNQNQGGGFKVPDAFASRMTPGVRNEWSMGTDTDGGYMVPERYDVSRVWRLNAPANIVRARAMVIPAGDPPDAAINFPALNQGENGAYGGVQVSWIAEGADKPETDAKLLEITLQPHEVAATTVVTDKLLRNWSAGASFIEGLLRGAMAHAEDVAFLTGDGTGKPTGVLGAAGAIAVNRATANDVSYLDVLTMLSRAYSGDSLVWVANQNLLPKIAMMTDDSGQIIFGSGDMSRGLPATLLGIPIVFTGKVPGVGTKGDLSLIDFSQYLIKDGSGPFVAASEHVLFRSNKTVIKCFWNVDGKPWVPAPLKLEDGTTVSPYVVLDVPAQP